MVNTFPGLSPGKCFSWKCHLEKKWCDADNADYGDNAEITQSCCCFSGAPAQSMPGRMAVGVDGLAKVRECLTSAHWHSQLDTIGTCMYSPKFKTRPKIGLK